MDEAWDNTLVRYYGLAADGNAVFRSKLHNFTDRNSGKSQSIKNINKNIALNILCQFQKFLNPAELFWGK